MGLMCECNYDGDWEPGMKMWHAPKEHMTLATKRSRKCCSCGDRIAVGATCAEVPRTKVPETEIEIRIYGEGDAEIPISSMWMCERCADLAFSLEDLGYCWQPWEDQRKLVADYAAMHAPTVTPNGAGRELVTIAKGDYPPRLDRSVRQGD